MFIIYKICENRQKMFCSVQEIVKRKLDLAFLLGAGEKKERA